MLVSWKWIKEYLSEGKALKVDSIGKIAETLSTKSFEVESIKEHGDDHIFDIDILPNRAHDCLCHLGIAKEIAINTKSEFKGLELKKLGSDFETKFKVNLDHKKCKRYILREVRNIEVGQSPKELKDKLEAIGQKSINNIVDITNIVMYELGQPMHAFDADKLEGNIINIRNSKLGEKIITLDNQEIELDDQTMVIADTDALAIAGIKGGKKAEVNLDTTRIILESANFDSATIRKNTKKTGIDTDSSKRFENEITPELSEKAIDRACELIEKYCGNDLSFSNIVDIYPRPLKGKYKVGFREEKVSKVLGTKIPKRKIEKILNSLDIDFKIVEPKKEVIEFIKEFEGKPYKYGASVTFDSPEKFDCGSLVSFAYSQFGVQIPRMTIDQYFACEPISQSDLEPGDLIFSNTGELIEDQGNKIHFESIEFMPGTKFELGIDHVGMYLGEGKVIHATSRNNQGVTIEDLNKSVKFETITACGRPVKSKDKRYVCEIQHERLDLRIESDLIEEIGRINGYEKIKPKRLVRSEKREARSNNEYESILNLKSKLQELGFSEVITYSFNKKGDLKVIKALASNKQYLRKSLEKGMIEALDLNHYNADLIGIDTVKIFEIGKIYSNGIETLVLGLGVRNKNFKKPKSGEILKDALEKINLEAEVKDDQEFVQISLSENEDVLENGSEIKFNNKVQVEKSSQYPFITRDLSVWIPESKGDEKVIYEVVERYTGNLLKTKRLFDKFEKDGRTSFAVRIVLQSDKKTLNDEEVSEIMKKVYDELKSKEGFEIR